MQKRGLRGAHATHTGINHIRAIDPGHCGGKACAAQSCRTFFEPRSCHNRPGEVRSRACTIRVPIHCRGLVWGQKEEIAEVVEGCGGCGGERSEPRTY